MLDSYENRKGYMLSFGMTVAAVVSVFIGQDAQLLGGLNSIIVKAGKSFPFVGCKHIWFFKYYLFLGSRSMKIFCSTHARITVLETIEISYCTTHYNVVRGF